MSAIYVQAPLPENMTCAGMLKQFIQRNVRTSAVTAMWILLGRILLAGMSKMDVRLDGFEKWKL
jgi:hypothetical protein